MSRLREQVALVTGASTGVGRATALALAAEGAIVAITARRAELLDRLAEEIRATGAEALTFPAGINDAAAVEAMIDAIVTRYGRLDILVNNAGTNSPRRTLANASLEEWREIVDVNLTGAFLTVRAALPIMQRQGRGTIVSITSLSAKAPTMLGGVAYTASKMGMVAVHKQAVLEGRPHGVRACLIYPGEIDTPLLDKRPAIPDDAARATMLLAEDMAETILFVATLPQRVNIEEMVIIPTTPRDPAQDKPRDDL